MSNVRRPLAIAALCVACAVPRVVAADPQTDEEKTLYALGLSIADSLKSFALTAEEFEMVKAGMADGRAGDAKVEIATYGPKIQALARERAQKVTEQEKEEGAKFLAEAAAKAGAVTAESGFVIRHLTEGSGDMPAATDTVKVHYRGTLRDGTEFDSSYQRNEPAQFGLNRVIKCWTEGVAMMKVGGKAELVCPADVAYGDRGAPPRIPGGATLVFEVELLEIVDAEAPAAAAQTTPAD